MLKIIFKIINRLKLGYNNISNWFFLYEKSIVNQNRLIVRNKITFKRPFTISFDASQSSVFLEEGINFRAGCVIISANDSKLIIRSNNFFNRNCSINCLSSIYIGHNNQFGESVKFYDHNHNFREYDQLINEQGYSTGKITIGNNCWFGSNVIILKDVEIGDNVVVGAGCIIHKSIPSNTVVINKQEQVFKAY